MDNWLVEKLDAAMTWAQKRGASLVVIHCWLMFLVFAGHLGDAVVRDSKSALFVCSFWAGAAWYYFRWADQNSDYRENYRVAQKLNASVIGMREREYYTRQYGLPVLVAMVLLFDVPELFQQPLKAILGGGSTLLVVLSVYLNTATYLAGGQPRSREIPNGVRADG